MGINTIDLKILYDSTENLYEAAMIVAKRARVLNERYGDMIKRELGEIENEEDFEEEKVEKEDIIDKFDSIPKPCKTALSELIEGKLEFEIVKKEEKE